MIDMELVGQIQYIAPEELRDKVAAFQPVSRTIKKNLKKLYTRIEEKGEVLQPIVISLDDGIIADGHRRLACALALKLPVIPVRVLKGKAHELFVELNDSARVIDRKTWNEAVALGLPPEIIPIEGRYIQRMIEVLGWEDYQVLALAGVTSYIYKTAESVGRFIGDSSDEMIGKIIRWMYNLKMQRPVIDAMKNNAHPAIIRKAIDTNRALMVNPIWVVMPD